MPTTFYRTICPNILLVPQVQIPKTELTPSILNVTPLSLFPISLFSVCLVSPSLAHTSVSHDSLLQCLLLCDLLSPQGLPQTQKHLDLPPVGSCTSNPRCTHCRVVFLKLELGCGTSCSKTVTGPPCCPMVSNACGPGTSKSKFALTDGNEGS